MKNRAKHGLYLVYFGPFLKTKTNTAQILTMMCLGFEPGDGSRRRIHWAMVGHDTSLLVYSQLAVLLK